jgi:hypothetical protein
MVGGNPVRFASVPLERCPIGTTVKIYKAETWEFMAEVMFRGVSKTYGGETIYYLEDQMGVFSSSLPGRVAVW